MVSATDLKNSTCFVYEGKPFRVVKYTHQKIGRGGATVKVSVRDLITGKLEEKTFLSTAKLEEISTSKKSLQYLYHDGENTFFMDPHSFAQVEIDKALIEDELQFIKEGEEVEVLFWDDQPISIEIPVRVVLKVIETDPGVKGNSSTNVYKPALCENGLSLRVPLFIKRGDLIKVDTRTGDYIERASQESTKGRR